MPICDTKELAQTLGITQARISQMKSQGRFDGCFTVVRNKIEWDKEAAIKAYTEGNPLVSTSPTRKKSDELEIPSFNESRAKSEHFRAELARLDLETKEQQLVEVARVQREAFTAARAVRDALGNIPDRVSNQFAAESDPVVIHQTLTEEIRKALETLTKSASEVDK
jgi:phage terminase Nu1 subunit (DNA packaging protein)